MGGPEALILVGLPRCVMEAVAYGRKKVRVAVKWDRMYVDLGVERSKIGVLNP